MADRATRVRVVDRLRTAFGSAARSDKAGACDAIFVAALVGLGVVASRYIAHPAIPADVCRAPVDHGPRYPELLADGRITIAAVFGEIQDGGRYDPAAQSVAAFTGALRSRGFVETAPSHYESGELAIDVSLLPHDEAATGRALTAAFASHELIYYNGHSDHGDVAFTAPADYRIALLDTCWSTQLFSSRLLGEDHDVISNDQRSVTGSVVSLLVVIDGLRSHAPTWQPLLDDVNARAVQRARIRAPISRYKEPEHYRLDARCPS